MTKTSQRLVHEINVHAPAFFVVYGLVMTLKGLVMQDVL